jgi:hypothetical protein
MCVDTKRMCIVLCHLVSQGVYRRWIARELLALCNEWSPKKLPSTLHVATLTVALHNMWSADPLSKDCIKQYFYCMSILILKQEFGTNGFLRTNVGSRH